MDEKYAAHGDGGTLESFGRMCQNDLKLYIDPSLQPDYLPIDSDDVLTKIRFADPSWDAMVPESVAEIIQRRRLFGWCAPLPPAPVVSTAGAAPQWQGT